MSSANTPTVGPLDPADTLPLQPGDLVADRYEVLRLVGSGGSALVYAVRDRNIHDEIALKVLRDGRRSGIDVERSRREAELARGATSARLVRTFDLCEAGGFLFLTMELVPGGSLRELLRNGPLAIDEVVRLAREILEALADLHRLNVVHRDLKPGNLLLTADGHIKLSDFGIARRTDDESHLTMAGLPVGTAAYLSPEQARAENVDARTDLYSLGVVLFEMLTGRVPFESPSAVGAIVMRLDRRAADVRTLRRDTPRWLAGVVERLLEPKREDRYASAEAVLADLHRRRARFSWRRAGVALAAGLLAIAGTVRYHAPDPKLVVDPVWGIRVVADDGRVLWKRDDAHFATIVHRGAAREVATVLVPSWKEERNPAYTYTLSFFDLGTGRPLRERALPTPDGLFPNFSDAFGVGQVFAADLDHDGFDEVAVTYVHNYYPSYIVVDDLRRNDARTVFIASGHHRIAQAVDVDGDGVADLIVSGTSNKMGWYLGVAAVRVPLGDAPHDVPATTPDRADVQHSTNLLWYALVPPGSFQPESATVDREQRWIRVQYRTGPDVELTFDGFQPSAPLPLSAAQRQAERQHAYEQLADAKRLSDGGEGEAAVAAARAAYASARACNDEWLAQWAQRVEGSVLAAAGRLEEADDFFRRICSPCEAAADVAWDAGHAFHLAGDLPRAVTWYRRTITVGGNRWVGRMRYESLEGLVLALGEMGQWSNASAAIDAYAREYQVDSEKDPYAQYVAWRTGKTVDARYDALQPSDVQRYWALEAMLARNEDPALVLQTADGEIARASETRLLVPLARSEALRRLGRIDEAYDVARQAYDALRVARRIDHLARAHFDVAAERLARLAEAKGLHDVTKQVRAEAAALRWHSNGMTQ